MSVEPPYARLLSSRKGRRHEVELDGRTTAYWVYGDEPQTGPPPGTVVAVHGFRGDHHGLEPIVAHLPDGVRVIVPDLPGFGESEPLGRGHDLRAYADWATAFARTVAPDAVILGHSFGTIVVAAAVAAGLDTPRLILINPIGAPALEGPRGILTRLAVLYYALGARLPARLGTWLLRSRVVVRVMSIAMAKTRDRALRRFIHDQHDRFFSLFADRDVLREAFVTSVSHDVRESAPQIQAPTLLIAADRDDITTIDAVRALRGLFPDARLVEIAGVGHLIHYEAPAEAAAAISRSLRGGRDA